MIITPTKSSDPAARGIIYDRNGYILARNVASYNVVITPAGLPDDDADIQRIYREVSELTGVPAGGPVTDETLANAKLFSACVPGPSIADMVALGDSLAPYTPGKDHHAISVKNLHVSFAKNQWIGPESLWKSNRFAIIQLDH